MAKIGAGLDAQRIQRGGGTPTPSETLRGVLSKTLGTLSEQIEIEPETTLEGVSESLPPVASEQSGFTPEGELLPLGERFRNQRDGIVNPTFDAWEQSGSQVDPDLIVPVNNGPNNDPVNTPQVAIPKDPVQDLFRRAKRQASMMDPTDKSQPTIRVRDTNVTDPARKGRYLELNQRIAMSIDPEETAVLEQERRDLAAVEDRENTILGLYLDELDAMKIDPETGYAAPDQKFLATGALATEHAVDNVFLGMDKDSSEAMFFGDVDEEGNQGIRQANDLVNPADAAERVGRETVKWWAAEKAANGETVDKNLTPQQHKDLGAAFLLGWAKANPNLVSIVRVKDDGTGNYVKDEGGRAIRFQLTPEGNAVLDANRAIRQNAMGIEIDPLSTPAPGLLGAAGEERPAFRKKSQIGGKEGSSRAYATLDEVHESIENQNSVAHVVDDRRLRITAAMLLPSMFAPIGRKDAFGDFFGIGATSFETTKLEKQYLDGMEEPEAFDEAVKIMNSKRKDAADDVMTLVKFRGRSNYLTHAMQPLAGRLMVQQTKFNPTRKKLIRFATRSKHPAVIRSRGTPQEKAYLNIMALSFGQDAKLEKGRFKDIHDNRAKYYKWGKLLEDALDSVFPNESFQSAVEVIGQGGKMDPALVKSLAQFQQMVATDPELMDLLRSKGEDAPMAIDALIDFRKFDDNMKAGKPHYTFVNGYVDGKTNGIANQGMMLGNRKLAVKVGALREDGSEDAVDGGDVRAEMARIISQRLVNTIPVIQETHYAGDAGKAKMIRRVLEIIGTERTINKQISMIFPYGKELNGLIGEINKLLPEVRANNTELDAMMKELNMDDLILSAANDNVIYSLFEIFGEDTFNTRGIMRSVGYMHALTDDLFSLRGPIGHRILLGDMRVVDGDPKSKSKVAVGFDKTDANVLHLQDSETYMSSAAKKRTTKGFETAGYVRGRSAVIPTQAFDAATVVRTTTGNSWKKLKDAHPQGDPYFFQIYDAYKVDVNSYSTLVEEANQNFLDLTTRDWNFIAEAKKEYDKLSRRFKEFMEADPKKEFKLSGGKFDYMYDLMDPQFRVTAAGPMATYRNMKSFAAAAFPINPKLYYDKNGYREMTADEKKNMTPDDITKGYMKFISAKAQRMQSRMHAAFNKHATDSTGRIQELNFVDAKRAPKLINSAQALEIFNVLEQETDLSGRLAALTEKTNRARASLRKEIMEQKRRTGVGARQFWAH